MDFSRILCSHEHYVALNLPSWNPQNSISEGSQLYSGASSPTPSVKSTDSQSSFVSHGKNQSRLNNAMIKCRCFEKVPTLLMIPNFN